MRTDRLLALLIAALVVVALVIRTQLTAAEDGTGLVAAFWQNLRFFTILTSGFVAAGLVLHSFEHRPLSASTLGGLTLAIVLVGVVYHALLAHLNDFTGIEFVIDHVFHTVVPMLAFLWWLRHAPKHPLPAHAPVLWLSWPAVYAAYAVTRGTLDGTYPYPFLDPDKLGWAGLLQSMAGLMVAFLIAGYLLWALGRRLSPVRAAPRPDGRA